MKPADHIKPLWRCNEPSRASAAVHFHSLQSCHYKHKDTESFANERSGVFGKQEICYEVINNIKITLLIRVFLKPRYTPRRGMNVSASSLAHMQMQVVVTSLRSKR